MGESTANVPDDVLRDYAQAYNCVASGRLDDAIPILESCIDRCPDFLTARRELALVLTREGKAQAALEHRLKVLDLAPHDTPNRLKCINLLTECKRYEEAVQVAEYLAQTAPADPEHVRLLDKLRNLARHGRIFISYRSNNASAARSVAEMLLRNDFDIWFAEYEVLSLNYDTFEKELERNLQQALVACQTAIVFTNRYWADSSYCQHEIRHISEHYDKGRILQICVPQQDERPARDWPILRAVATTICGFSNAAETAALFDWVLDQLDVSPENRRSVATLEGLGNFVPLHDTYRGGTLGALRVGPFQPWRTPWWYHLSNRADFHSFLFGWPCATFRCQSKDPAGNLGLVIDIRVDRWTGQPATDDLQDDRATYRHLRAIAQSGYQRHGTMAEGGLHLFHFQGRGNLGITFRSPVRLGYYLWRRIYVLVVQNDDGSYGEVNINFSLAFPERISGEIAFRHFCAFLPLFDTIAGSLEYTGIRTRTPLTRIRTWWAVGGTACLIGGVALVQWLSDWSVGPVAYSVGAMLGAILGLTVNHRLMVVPNRTMKREQENKGEDKDVIAPKIVFWSRLLAIALLVSVVAGVVVGAYVGLVTGIVVGLLVGAATTPGANPSVEKDAASGTPATTVVGAVICAGLMVAPLAGVVVILSLRQPWAVNLNADLIVTGVALLVAVGLVRAVPRLSFFVALLAGAMAGAAAIPRVADGWLDAPISTVVMNAVVSAAIGATLAGLWGGAEAAAKYYNYIRNASGPTSNGS